MFFQLLEVLGCPKAMVGEDNANLTIAKMLKWMKISDWYADNMLMLEKCKMKRDICADWYADNMVASGVDIRRDTKQIHDGWWAVQIAKMMVGL